MNVICYATVEKGKKYKNNKIDKVIKQNKKSKVQYFRPDLSLSKEIK